MLYLGMVAACLTTFAFVPQVVKVIRTKNVESIALGMYLMQVLGIGLWLLYGIFLKDISLVVANSISLLFSAIILYYKLKYHKQERKLV